MITTAASRPQISEKFSLKARRAIRLGFSSSALLLPTSAAEVEIHVPKNNIHFVRDHWVTSTHPALQLSLMTLSLEEYSYLNALNAAGVWGFEGAFLTEPVTFPSNVEGGLGFVSIASASGISLALPELE